MRLILNYPRIFFVIVLLLLWLATSMGAVLQKRRPMQPEERDDFAQVVTATLTLLGLIIGFTFSMAIGRYDQRKNYEEAEANAIGTEYVRADLLPAANAAAIHQSLVSYADQRMLFYITRDTHELDKINADTAALQSRLWSEVQGPATAQPTPVMALVVSGMNDVLNSQGYTQAAWWNRIPTEAWILLAVIAAMAHVLIGYGARHARSPLVKIMPIAIALSLFLIGDNDSPRGGLIRVRPQNLEALVQSLHRH
jgi:hypothetical protein